MSARGELQRSGMLSQAQFLHLFTRFSSLISQPDAKKRIADAVNDNQEAVAATTAVQEEIFLEMGVDPSFGLSCLGKVNMVHSNDQYLVVRFYEFLAEEEIACDEAELDPSQFVEKMNSQKVLHDQQLEMLRHMRKFHLDDQYEILEKLHQQMEAGNFENGTTLLSEEQIQEIVRRRVSPVFKPR